MISKLLLIFLSVVLISSCSTAYKTGQTPDDVYFSPVRLHQFDSTLTRRDENQSVYKAAPDDSEIRSRNHNRRWRRYHEYDYGYYPYGTETSVYSNLKRGKPSVYNAPRRINTAAYKKNPPPVIDIKTGKPDISPTPVRTFRRPSNSPGSGVGNFLRKVFDGANTTTSDPRANSNTNNSTNGSNSSSTSNNPQSGSSGTTTKAPVRKFGN